MGIQDFVAVFERLDAAHRGFVTVEQVVTFHEAVYLTPVSLDQVEAAVQQVCGVGHGGKVSRDAFLPVLEEVARRQSVEEQAYWDFQALDYNGSHRIKLEDALTLFQEYHGDSFSLHTWHHFLQSRPDPSADVSFDEIREWLCSQPSGQPASDREIRGELSQLEQSQWEHFHQEYRDLKTLKDGEDDNDQYLDDIKRNAHRKLQKWDRQGLGAMLSDDGLDAEGEDTVHMTRRKDTVSITDLLDAMDIKYSMLTDTLVSHMASFAATVALYWVERQSEIEKHNHNVADSTVSAAVLADLQQKQEMDFAQCLHNMKDKRGEDLISLLKQESKTRFHEYFNNVAFVVLGAVDLSQEDQEYLDALTDKYKATRDQVFIFALKDKLGLGAWNSMGREGRQAELLKLRKEEKRLRGDGQLVEMAGIIGPKSQALPALVHLMGENKGYGKGFASSPVTAKPVNLLGDLVPRFDLEQEHLLSWLHSEEVKSSEGSRQKLRELASLEMERFGVGVDGDYESALIALGLLERISTVPGGRSKADKEKQQKLAGKRVALRKWRTRQGEPCKIPAEDKADPTPGDRLSWQQAVLRSMLRRHLVERELLLRLLQDPGFGDLVEAAGLMVAEDRWQQLSHLAEKHQGLNLSTPDGREENVSILEEAAALRVVGVRALARQQSSRAMSEDEVSTSLLTELQDLHDTELSDFLLNGLEMDEAALQQKLEMERSQGKRRHAHSIMTVLTRIDGDLEITDVFVKILEEKYTALREALLLSSVMQKGGQRLSQKQRDKQIQALRKEIVPLWDAGDAEQVAKALGLDLTFPHPLMWLLGMERSKFAKERESAGEEGQAVKEPAISEDAGVLAAVRHLMQRYAEEKDSLLSSLAGANGQFMSENMKTALKSRLKRERNLIVAEEELAFAALACGLAEREAEDISTPSLENDKERYSLLARHEYGVRQSGREGRPKKDSLTVERKENRETLQDAVLNLLLKKHQEERQLLAEMLINPRFENVQRDAAVETSQQRSDRLAALKAKRQSSNLETSSDNIALLQEALVVFREIRRGQLGQGSAPEDDLHLNCEMMAALLMLQNSEAEQYLADFASEDLSEMIESQEQILEEFRKNHCVNIASLVFSPGVFGMEDGSVDPLVEALDGKYDALRDKLLMEALMKQMGEKNWQNLSERERQRKLMEMKLKERQLRRDGKYDELAALLGDAINNEATLKKLLGENRDEYDRKLKERLEKRRQRLAEGMSEEECDRLEKEEEEQEEEEARQRHRNVLEDLQHNFDQERDALLRQLQDGGNNAEKERQRKMLQLKLDQRRLRRDDEVFTTALILQQHDQAQKDKESERLRQEQLAKERLEAARLRKKGAGKEDDGQLSVIAADLETEEDRLKLQEMALTSLDLKHQAEREFFMDLLNNSSESETRQAARRMSQDLWSRLDEIQEVLQAWRGSNVLHHLDEPTAQLFAEAVAYKLELKKQEEESEGRFLSESDLLVCLMADLQQQQDKETADIMTSALDMNEDELKQLTRSIIKKKEDSCYDNTMQVLLHPGRSVDGETGKDEGDEEGLTEEEKEERKVVKALEMKYDALRDKLLIEALIKEHGEVEWKRMSEIERQRKLVELKRKERQLRHEGKMDEVEALLGEHLKHKQDLDSVIGQSQQEQKRRLEERLARRRQLQAERESQGLAVDEQTLDEIQDEEEREENAKRKNVLENLQMHFEDEKAALLAGLHQYKDATERERERQRALVKLQRDRQHLQAEEKLDSAALIFSIGKQHDEDRQESLIKERERQRQLARKRLMERRRQILEGKEGGAEIDTAPPVIEDDIPENIVGDGVQQLQEGALLALDRHQGAERDTLLQLLARCRRDKEGAKSLKNMSEEEIRLKLTRAEKEHVAWKKDSAKKMASLADPRLPAKRRSKLTQKAVQRWQAQLDILGQAVAHKLELERRQLEKLRPNSKEEELWEELCVITLADLQERQMMLFSNFQESIFKKSKEELEALRKTQKSASREGWFESLSNLAFSVEDLSGEVSLSDRQAAEAKLQEEFAQQKQALLEKVGGKKRGKQAGIDNQPQPAHAKHEDLDADAMLRDLEAQHAAKKKKIAEDMERQRGDVMQRLEARRRRQMDRNFEAEAAVHMLKEAESQSQAALDRTAAERGNQKSLLQQRLQQRREARQRAALSSRQEDTRMVSSPMPGSEGIPRSDSVSTVNSMGMRREKSLIDTSVSDDQKKAIYDRLVKQQLNEQYSKTAQRQKQEEELKRRLEARKGKREDEVAALFSLGERQKTFLEQAKKGEQDRQIAQMRERVTRVKYERTRTKAPGHAPSGKGFADQALEEGDEIMEEKARELEEKLKRTADESQSTDQSSASEPSQKTEKSRMDILKERRKQKKQQRQEKD